jgi:EAL domain-containing protein (putative c-di-GMP-specific phosphodiesterase class I)
MAVADTGFSSSVRHYGARQIESDLRKAVSRSELELFYQPQVDLDRQLIGMEALLRWNHPAHGMLLPYEFIPIAEQTGLIVPIGSWVIGEACRQWAEWQASFGSSIKVAVNISALQFYFSDLPEVVRMTLEEAAVPPQAFGIELTETVLMRNTEQSATALQRLRQLGVTIAIDDFGTGYSSLSYLQYLPVDALKIDRSFLQQIHLKTTSAVVQAITNLAHGLGLRVVAEGVETAEQMDLVRCFGVDLVQGFLIGRPMPSVKAGKYLARWTEQRTPAAGHAGCHIPPRCDPAHHSA